MTEQGLKLKETRLLKVIARQNQRLKDVWKENAGDRPDVASKLRLLLIRLGRCRSDIYHLRNPEPPPVTEPVRYPAPYSTVTVFEPYHYEPDRLPYHHFVGNRPRYIPDRMDADEYGNIGLCYRDKELERSVREAVARECAIVDCAAMIAGETDGRWPRKFDRR